MRVTVLGCGGSNGVPTIGTRWGTCDPANPKNRRRRPSVLVEEGGTVILVDTTPDLREQLIDARVEKLDAVLYSHDHADHSHGLDDLREINRLMGAAVPVFGIKETLDGLASRFGYCFHPLKAGENYYRPELTPHVISGSESTDWVVDCVRMEPHPVHSHLENTLEWIERVRPRRAWLTHMNNTMDYDTLVAILPPGVMPAHDGLVIEVASQ